MEAIILAGGLGTRLRDVVSDKPKALSIVAGKPFLHYVIDYLLKEKISRFIFSLGYLSEQIIDFLKNDYPFLEYDVYVEEQPLGTGGAIKKSIELSQAKNVFIINADTYFSVDMQLMYQLHIETNADCTFSLKEMQEFDRYGTVKLNEQQSILSFVEKTYQKNGLINGGYLILNKDVFLALTNDFPKVFSFEKDFLEKNMHQILLKGYISDGYFIDIGIPEDYLKAQKAFSNISPSN